MVGWHGVCSVFRMMFLPFSRFRWPTWAALLAFGLVGPAFGAGTAQASALESHDICARAIESVERSRKIPNALMTAIAQTESGRWNKSQSAVLAWPWTVTNGKDGRFFPTKTAAMDHVRSLQARGIRNIDVGCMQINLLHHPDAFDDLETAFDPSANAAYAARFLTSLFAQHKSWSEAIRRYHSSNEKFNRPYHAKVARAWNTARRGSAEAHHQSVIARHLAERARLRNARNAQLADAR